MVAEGAPAADLAEDLQLVVHADLTATAAREASTREHTSRAPLQRTGFDSIYNSKCDIQFKNGQFVFKRHPSTALPALAHLLVVPAQPVRVAFDELLPRELRPLLHPPAEAKPAVGRVAHMLVPCRELAPVEPTYGGPHTPLAVVYTHALK